ncbi:MAG TPA: GNAT family N-acetyltransferase [Xanthobacteraceae bacterium]|jgi:putative acetyltransferase|nr:GNAT family N-acetyltransferase [Xanthobacteraceae bacterium]
MNLAIERVNEPTPELRELIGELDDVLNAAYEPHQRHGLAIAQLFEPHVRFFVARLDAAAAACGGVALFDDYAEVKRMYTRPAARGRGVAKAVLRRLEQEARASGKPVLRLETGQHQAEAVGLYRAAGFISCGPFGHYARMPTRDIELSLFFEKAI